MISCAHARVRVCVCVCVEVRYGWLLWSLTVTSKLFPSRMGSTLCLANLPYKTHFTLRWGISPSWFQEDDVGCRAKCSKRRTLRAGKRSNGSLHQESSAGLFLAYGLRVWFRREWRQIWEKRSAFFGCPSTLSAADRSDSLFILRFSSFRLATCWVAERWRAYCSIHHTPHSMTPWLMSLQYYIFTYVYVYKIYSVFMGHSYLIPMKAFHSFPICLLGLQLGPLRDS